jgi:hypothetical protein
MDISASFRLPPSDGLSPSFSTFLLPRLCAQCAPAETVGYSGKVKNYKIFFNQYPGDSPHWITKKRKTSTHVDITNVTFNASSGKIVGF